MTELHLVGYTADLRHLVLEVRGTHDGDRYRLVVDADLLLTVEELRERRHEAGLDPELQPVDPARDEPNPPADGPVVHLTGDEGMHTPAEAQPDPQPQPQPQAVATQPQDEVELEEQEQEQDPGGQPDAGEQHDPVPPEGANGDAARSSALSPAEIQAQLRAGRSARSVAKAAGTEVAWVERWLAPILEERHQALTRARELKLRRPRLGTSRLPLGAAVERNLRSRKVDPEDVAWSARRLANGTWTVTVRYRSRGRPQSASWRMDRDTTELTAVSDLAKDLGFVAPARRTSGR